MYSFIIHSWMIKDLNLSGNDLLIYANIYQFSGIPGNYFTASLSKIADNLNISINTVQRSIKKLIDDELITKETVIIDNVNICRYAANLVKIPSEGIAKMDIPHSQNGSQYNINNINNNKTNNIEINKYNNIGRGLFSMSKSNERRSQKIARMSKMLDAFILSEFENNKAVKSALKDYFNIRVHKGLEPEQFSKILEALKLYVSNGWVESEIVNMINNATSAGYMVLVPDWKLKNINKPVDNIERQNYDNLDHNKSRRSY